MDKILNNLGLCQRANGLISGEENVITGLQNGTVKYLFLAHDASANTIKMILDKAKFYKVEVDKSYSSYELSHAIGKENRMVLGITTVGFLKILKK